MIIVKSTDFEINLFYIKTAAHPRKRRQMTDLYIHEATIDEV